MFRDDQKEGSVTPDQVENDPVEHLQPGRAQKDQRRGDGGHADRLIQHIFRLCRIALMSRVSAADIVFIS